MVKKQYLPLRVAPLLHRAVLLPLVLMSLLAAVMVWQINHLLAVVQWVDHADQVISRANGTYRLLADQEAGYRGYLLTGARDFLEPYERAEHRLEPTLAGLGALVRDDPPQVQRLARVRSTAAAWQQFAVATMDLRKRGGDYQEAVFTRSGKRSMEHIRTQLAEFIRVEEELRDRRVRTAAHTVTSVLATAVGLSLLLALVLGFLTSRQILLVANSYQRVIQERQETQDLFHRFMEHSPALSFVRDAAGRIVYANAAYERFFGATLAQLMGRTLSEVMPKATADRLQALIERVMAENQPLEGQETVPGPGGRPHTCAFHLFPITDSAGGACSGAW